jgi:phospholipid-binding lipoprotein MlaA
LRPATLPAVLIVLLLAPVVGRARTLTHAAGTPGDPWEVSNRRVFALNQSVDRAVIRPLSRLTSGLTPGPIGRAVHNFVVNLHEPVVILNDLLQARPGPAIRSAFRLVINSTVGLLGAIDVAHALGDPAHKNGFGDTLGRWGAKPGPYLVVPVLGPSTVRDLFGSAVDDATEPLKTISFPYNTEVDITVSIVGGLNERSEVGKELDALLAGAADPYATLRSSYLQSREAEIRGSKALPPLPEIEDATPPAAPSPTTAPPPTGALPAATTTSPSPEAPPTGAPPPASAGSPAAPVVPDASSPEAPPPPESARTQPASPPQP